MLPRGPDETFKKQSPNGSKSESRREKHFPTIQQVEWKHPLKNVLIKTSENELFHITMLPFGMQLPPQYPTDRSGNERPEVSLKFMVWGESWRRRTKPRYTSGVPSRHMASVNCWMQVVRGGIPLVCARVCARGFTWQVNLSFLCRTEALHQSVITVIRKLWWKWTAIGLF